MLTVASVVEFSHHSKVVNLSFKYHLRPAHNGQQMSDRGSLHWSKPSHCSTDFGRGMHKNAMDFAHFLIVIRHGLPSSTFSLK